MVKKPAVVDRGRWEGGEREREGGRWTGFVVVGKRIAGKMSVGERDLID